MIGLLAVAMLCGTTLIGGRYVLRTLSRRWDNEIRAWQTEKFAEAGRQNIREITRRDIEERKLALAEKRQRDMDLILTRNGNIRDNIASAKHALEERRVAIEEQRHKSAPRPEPMPYDLAQRPMQWEDQWMQEQERSNIQSLYAELGSWEKVRLHLKPLTAVIADEPAAPRDFS